MSKPPLRIAWFSDLSKGAPESLSAYCSRLLLPELAQGNSIELFSESFSTEEFGLPHYHYLKAYQRHRENPFDVFFYQLEDGEQARFVRGHIGLIPGVVWIHDLFCRDLGPEACHTSPWEQSIKQFYDSAVRFADRARAPHQLWPRVFRESSLCPVVLFSSAWAHSEFLQMTSSRLEATEGGHRSEVLQVPVVVEQPSQRSSAEFRVAVAGLTGIEGRAHKILPVLRDWTSRWRLVWMVSDEEHRAARELVNEFGLPEESVDICGPRSPDLWQQIVSQSHVALHLHTSPFGHLAPYTQISLATSCPVVVARSGQGEDLPDSVVFRVIPGTDESAQIRGVFELLQQRSEYEYGTPGKQYIQRSSTPAEIATHLAEMLRASAPQVSYVMERWGRLHVRAKAVLMDEVRQLVGGGSMSLVDPFDAIVTPAARDLGWVR